MNRQRSAAEIAAAWQAAIERDVETGRVSRLALITSGTAADATPALLALQTATVQRTDVTAPWLITGDVGAAWLGALAPEPVVVFGGVDAATQLATWAMTAGLDVAPELTPRLHAGVSPRWDAWPLLEAGDPPPSPLQDQAVAPDPAADWTAWGVMLLALCLVLSAFLL